MSNPIKKEPVYIVDEKRLARDTHNEKIFREDILVPANLNIKLAHKYEMAPGDSVGQYITKLNGIMENGGALTDDQAQQVMLITLASVLYSAYEFSNTPNFLKEDVSVLCGHLAQNIGDSGDDEENSRWGSINYGVHYQLHELTNPYVVKKVYAPQQKAIKNLSENLVDYYRKYDGVKGFNNNSKDFFYDWGRLFKRYLDTNHNDFYAIRQHGKYVYALSNLVMAVINMGGDYAIGPAINLYANAVLAHIEESKKLHAGTYVYPRCK